MSFLFRSFSFTVSIVLSSTSFVVFAENSTPPTQDGLVVDNPLSTDAGTATTTPAPDAPTSSSTNAAVISATRFSTTIDVAPANVTVLTAQDISASHALSLGDALQQLGGVRVQSGAGTTVDLGGFGATGGLNTLILLNGRRLNDVDLSGANLAAIPLQSIERIEIVRGTSTVLYGDNAVGGVINIVTQNGFEGPAISAFVRGGSFATRELGLQGRGSSERMAVVADANRLSTDGYRDHGASEVTRFTSELTVPRGDTTWGARVFAYRDEAELPGALTEDQYRQDQSAAGDFLMDTQESQTSIDLFFNSPDMAMEFAFRDKNQESKSNYDGKTDAHLTTLSLTPRYRMSDDAHVRIVGIDLYRSTLGTRGQFPASFFGPASDNKSDVTRDSIALYASDTYSLNSVVSLGLGLRAQTVGLDLKNHDQANATGASKDRNNLDYGWDMSLQFRYPGGARSHVRLARSFRFAVLDEMWSYTNGSITLLDPQTGRHFEAGAQFPLTHDTQFDIALFRIQVTDEIAFDPALYANVNLDPTQHFGADISLKTKPLDPWTLRLMHSYRDATFSSGTMDGKTIPEIPRETFTLANTVDTGIVGVVSLDAQFVGKRYFGSDYANNGKQMNSYTQLNGGWSYTIPRGDIRVGINNLTDRKIADVGIYSEYASTQYYSYYPIAGRSYSVSVRAKF